MTESAATTIFSNKTEEVLFRNLFTLIHSCNQPHKNVCLQLQCMLKTKIYRLT